MVEFIKNSDNYGIYIVESSIDTDDWLDDHDHIKELDWDLVTEGTDGLYLPYVSKCDKIPQFTFDIIDFFKGAGADISMGEGHWLYKAEGQYGGSSEATRNTKEEQILKMYNSHLISGKILYLGFRKRGEIWKPFVNSSDNIKYYLKGKLLLIPYSRKQQQNYFNWKLTFRGVW